MTLPFWVWCHQLRLSFTKTTGCFDHQYPWKELISALDFLYGVNRYGAVALETNTFGGMRL